MTTASVKRLAVCVATCGRPALLERLLARLAEVDFARLAPPGSFLVVVDNRPGDGDGDGDGDGSAREACERWRRRLPVPLRFTEEHARGISFARNRALGEAFARGADFVAFLDDDDLPRRDWLAPLLAAQAERAADLTFGCWELPHEADEVPPLLRATKFFRPPDPTRVNRYGLPQHAGTYNVLIARALVERIAPDGVAFAPELALVGGSDTDLFIRAARAGAVIASAPDSLVERGWDAGRCTWRGVLKRAFRNGVSHATLERRHLDRRAFRRRAGKGLLATGLAYARLPLAVPLALPTPAGDDPRRRRAARVLLDAARRTGELWVYAGGGFRYYAQPGRRRGGRAGWVGAALAPFGRRARKQ